MIATFHTFLSYWRLYLCALIAAFCVWMEINDKGED